MAFLIFNVLYEVESPDSFFVSLTAVKKYDFPAVEFMNMRIMPVNNPNK